MIRWLALMVTVSVSVVILSSTLREDSADALLPASPLASPEPCPLTQPNGNHPPSSGNLDRGGYGNDALWTNLNMWSETPGVVLVPDDGRVTPDGVIHDMKWAWYQYVPGSLTIEGRRLDAPSAPLDAGISAGYGDVGFQASGLTFPSAGCWEITGRVGDASLTFVVLVVATVPAEARPMPVLVVPAPVATASPSTTS